MGKVTCIEAAAAELRLEAARAFVHAQAARGDVLLVGASRGAADDLARAVAATVGATLGIHRFSLTQLAARLAAPLLAAERLAPASALGAEAVAARAAFEAGRDGSLDYFRPVSRTPGFPRALARTLQELRLAGVPPSALASLPLGGRDLARLLERFDEQFGAASASDRAALFAAASSAFTHGAPPPGFEQAPAVLLLDVPFESAAERTFLRALMSASRGVLLTVPFGDVATLEYLKGQGIAPEVLEQRGPSDLVALRRNLFASRQPPTRARAGDVRVFSAPGEGREAIEIARRILDEARAGVPFEEMAVLLRAPQRYVGLVEQAFNRAGIPAWFDRGARRPHPAGRAFLAMLACACEKLSARRFAEYLSLAQVPQVEARLAPVAFTPPADETAWPLAEQAAEDTPADPDAAPDDALIADEGDAAVVDGMLRAPWKWEALIVESAVVGGDPARWRRRLDGLAHEYRVRIVEERREDPESPRLARLERDQRNLAHLSAFALPIVEQLAAWPPSGTWGEWLDRFAALAPAILRHPGRVVGVLEELRPMSEVGPVSLVEARDVIADRLLTIEAEPKRHRYGAVFVASPHHARGRMFRAVFVPGLAERMFPQRPHEDPMLLDREMREPLDAGLPLQEDRGRAERLLLRLAAGAATERLWLSYPRIDIGESRPRVPSFYALDVMRAITGRIPNHEELQDEAAVEGGAGLAWPAPQHPSQATDDFEHDLAVLRELFQAPDAAAVRGHAHYLLRLNDALRRSVAARWSRGRSRWTPSDGITRLTDVTRPLLAAQRLSARPYSLSALQKFAVCPYQFFLSAVHRLEPAEDPEPLQRLDPLTRGALFHEIQARFFRALQAESRLPVTAAGVAHALAVADALTAEVAAEYRERLAPAIERVWNDEIADIARDLRVWVQRLPAPSEHTRAARAEGPAPSEPTRAGRAEGPAYGNWLPRYFELSFGLPLDEDHDPASLPDPIVIDGRFMLRGAVDVIEEHQDGSALRVTDHKTGKNRTTGKTVLGGGRILQPVLYSMAIEQALGRPVASGRLFYCTTAGGFAEREIPLNDVTRRAGLEALEIVDRAIELGFLPAAPDERVCAWCDFRPICGPDQERRVARKPAERLGDLIALREKP
jgi:ATP-dependent helicase/nuclease subunit B